jgi:hypothetical protein
MNPWDVPGEFVTNMMPQYGVTVPLFFCPGRNTEFQLAQQRFMDKYHRTMTGPSDLWLYYTTAIPNWEGGSYGLMNHSWWVPRGQGNGVLFPVPFVSGAAANTNGWPTATTDRQLMLQPILTDLLMQPGDVRSDNQIGQAVGGHPRSPGGTPPGWGWQNTGLDAQSVNRAYGDGHAEKVTRAKIHWQYSGNYSSYY